MLKKILNLSEQRTHAHLSEVCASNGATAFSKLRLADVLPIENSGISNLEYSFALKSHFDFVVAKSDSAPLFAVEFDGPSHTTPAQIRNDLIKDKLCRQFGLPLLRINSEFLRKTYRRMDLLSWFVEVWFMQEDFDRQQAAGKIPYDEVFDPFAIIMSEGKEGIFPYWLSAPLLIQFRKLYEKGKCSDPVCCHFIGSDEAGNYHGISWLFMTNNIVVIAKMSTKSQNFPVIVAELLSELLVYEVHKSVTLYLEGKISGLSLVQLKFQIADFKTKYRLASAFTVGDLDKY